MNFFDKTSLRNIPRMADDGGGAGAGAASGAGSAAAGAAGGAAGQGADVGAGAGQGSGNGAGAAGSGGQQQQKPFYDGLGLDNDSVAWIEERKFGSLADTIKAGREGSKLARDRNVIAKPDPKNLQGWDGYSELGWVADRTKYSIEAPTVADGDIHDEAAFAHFQGVAHEAKLAPWQAKAVYDAMHKQGNEARRNFLASAATANKELDTALRSKWGDGYDQKVELGKRAFSALKIDGLAGAELDQAFGSPRVVELFARLGEMMGEGVLVGDKGGSNTTLTPEGARAQRKALETNKDWMAIFNDARHPQNKDYVEQRQRLLNIEAGQRA